VKRIVWTDPAKSDVRSLSKPVAMHIFSALLRFAQSGVGNAKALQGRDELRLRIGGYRLFFVMLTLSRFAESGIAAKLTDEEVR
jgi:mRNA-degrading endonuclease RelE of RelBE toxin-antitoxin system